MTQFSTDFYHRYGLPGHMFVHPRETEPMLVPEVAQVTTINVPPAPDPLPIGTYTFTFALLGFNVVVELVFVVAPAAAAFRTALADALNADPGASNLFVATVVGDDVVLTYRDSTRSFTVPTIVQPGGSLITVSITTVQGGTALAMGLLYAYADPQPTGPGGITPTPRGAFLARPLELADTVDEIRGIVGRQVNATELDPFFQDATTIDQYLPGMLFPGVNRHEVIAVCETPMAVGDDVFAVRNVGAFTQVGAITNVADGANTVQISGVAGNFRARVIRASNDVGLNGLIQTLCVIKMNQPQ